MENLERFPELETERLVLREITMEDLEWYHKHFSIPEVVEGTGFPAPVSIEAAKEELELYIVGLFRKRQGFRWGIVKKGEGNLIGSCGFYGWIKQPGNRAKIGYDLNPAYWGQGIVKEALGAIIAFGFEWMGLNRIEALIPVYNSRSIGLAKSLGFKREGVLRERSYFAGKYSDDVCFSLLKREWSN